jgi:hypothetical protein
MPLHFFPNQRASIQAALQVLDELPQFFRWSLTITEADTWEDPSVLNVFTRPGGARRTIGEILNLHEIVDEGETFTSYRVGPLLVSIVEEE